MPDDVASRAATAMQHGESQAAVPGHVGWLVEPLVGNQPTNGCSWMDLANQFIKLKCIYKQLNWILPFGELTFCHGKSPFLIGKPSINGPCSIAMLVHQRLMG